MDIEFTRYLKEIGCFLSNQIPSIETMESERTKKAVLDAIEFWHGKDFLTIPDVKAGEGAYHDCMFTDIAELAVYTYTSGEFFKYGFPELDGQSQEYLQLSFIAASAAKTGISLFGESFYPAWLELCTVSTFYRGGLIPYDTMTSAFRFYQEQYNPRCLIIGDGTMESMGCFIESLVSIYRQEGYSEKSVSLFEKALMEQYYHEEEHFNNITKAYCIAGLPYRPLATLDLPGPDEGIDTSMNFGICISPFWYGVDNRLVDEIGYWRFFKTGMLPAIRQSAGDEWLHEHVFRGIAGLARKNPEIAELFRDYLA